MKAPNPALHNAQLMAQAVKAAAHYRETGALPAWARPIVQSAGPRA